MQLDFLTVLSESCIVLLQGHRAKLLKSQELQSTDWNAGVMIGFGYGTLGVDSQVSCSISISWTALRCLQTFAQVRGHHLYQNMRCVVDCLTGFTGRWIESIYQIASWYFLSLAPKRCKSGYFQKRRSLSNGVLKAFMMFYSVDGKCSLFSRNYSTEKK